MAMIRARDKLGVYYLKIKNFWDQYKKLMLAGSVFWLGVLLIVMAVLAVKGHTPTYAANAVDPAKGMQLIKNDIASDKPFTLILYAPDCKDCKKAQKKMMMTYLIAKENKNADYLVLDVKKLNKKQWNELIRQIPQIAVYGDKLATPTVVNVVPTEDASGKSVVEIDGLSQDANPKHYLPVLNESKKLQKKVR